MHPASAHPRHSSAQSDLTAGRTLGLESSLPIIRAAAEANELLGITPQAGTPLPAQVDALIGAIFGQGQ